MDQPSTNALCTLSHLPVLCVFDQRGGDVVLPLLIRNGEATHFGLAVIAVGSGSLGQRIVRLVVIGERGEWHGESHVLGQDLLGFVVGDHPLDEVERGLLVLFGGVLVHRPARVIHSYGAAILLALDAHVVGEHAQVLIGHVIALDLRIRPHAVRVERHLAEREFGGHVIVGLGAHHACLGWAGLELQVEHVLVVLEIRALDGLRERGVRVPILVVERQTRHMRSESVRVGGIQARGGERAVDAEVVLVLLDGFCHLLQGLVVLDVIGGLDHRITFGAIILDDLLVVDDAVPFGGVRQGVRIAVDGVRVSLAGIVEQFEHVGVLQRFDVLLILGELVEAATLNMVGALSLASSDFMVASYVPAAPVWMSTCTPVFLVYMLASSLYWSTTSALLFMKYTWPLLESALLPPQAASDVPMASVAAMATIRVMLRFMMCSFAWLLNANCG